MGDVDRFWPAVRVKLVRAIEENHGEYTLSDIYNFLSRGTMQLWIVAEELDLKSVFVTEIITYPRMRVCFIVLAAGEGLDDLVAQLDVVEQWAGELGVDELRIQGRRGWQRVLRSKGFSLSYTVLRKVLQRGDGHLH
jgi:hypothetical protein